MHVHVYVIMYKSSTVCTCYVRIWNPIHLVYGGMYWYVPVRTGMYAYTVHTSTYFSRYSYGGTYQYVPVRTWSYQYRKITKSTYEYVLFRVCHGTRRYKAVQGSTRKILSRYMAVHSSFYPGLWRYKAVQGCTLTGFARGRGGLAASWRQPILVRF